MIKIIYLLFVISCVSAQYYPSHYAAAPTITSQQSNILRSFGNLGQVSTHSKTIDTPFSSVSKSDVRVSNPGYGFAAPAYAHHGYAAPALAVRGYAAPVYAGHGYAAPVYAGHGYAAPVVQKAVVGAPGLLGVAFSASPAVSHMSYSSGLGYTYTW